MSFSGSDTMVNMSEDDESWVSNVCLYSHLYPGPLILLFQVTFAIMLNGKWYYSEAWLQNLGAVCI